MLPPAVILKLLQPIVRPASRSASPCRITSTTRTSSASLDSTSLTGWIDVLSSQARSVIKVVFEIRSDTAAHASDTAAHASQALLRRKVRIDTTGRHWPKHVQQCFDGAFKCSNRILCSPHHRKRSLKVGNGKRVSLRRGSIIAIPLPDGMYGYGILLRNPMVAFFDYFSDRIVDTKSIQTQSIAFTIAVMNQPVKDGDWPIIGRAPLTNELMQEPLFYKRDRFTGKLTIYRDSTGEEFPATKEQCVGLECAAVWSANHVTDRLMDHHKGLQNKWVNGMLP